MKRYFIALAVLAVPLMVARVVAAQENIVPATITQEKIATIRDRCIENQAALNRLHQTDLFLRNDRGELYQTISEKLMVPFSRRLAANQLDGGVFIDLSAGFREEYTRFSRAFIEYDNALTKVLSIDCTREPVTFYNNLVSAREKRDALSRSNQALMSIIRQYETAFSDYKAKFEQEAARAQ